MKILVNDYPVEPINTDRQLLPGDTKIEFLTDSGKRFVIMSQINSQGAEGIEISLGGSSSQMLLVPQYRDVVEIY